MGRTIAPLLVLLVSCEALGPRLMAAQDSVIVIDPDAPAPPDSLTQFGPPPEVLRSALKLFNDSSTTRLVGDLTLPAASLWQGSFGLYRGVLRVYGRVRGPVVVINGDLIVAPGGVIQGDVVLIGGRFQVLPGGRHEGTARRYAERAAVSRGSDGLLVVRDRRRSLADLSSARASFQTGQIRTTLSLETARAYNRIEGLPVVFGPTFLGDATPGIELRLDVRGIFRTAQDQSKLRGNLGYLVRHEWRLGASHNLGFGARVYDVIETIEDQPLSRGESGLASFLFQRDYHDYFLTSGRGAYAFAQPRPGLRLEASYRDDEERTVGANDPISLFRNADRWRPNPLIDDGHFRTFRLRFDLDSRNNKESPTNGWLLQAQYEYSNSDDASPVILPRTIRAPIPTGREYHFGKLWVDARRYARLDPRTRFNLRIVGGGWVTGDPLPIQRRLSLGGTELLPGYDFRQFTCAPTGFVDPASAGFCDRNVVAQAELRRRVNLGLTYRFRNPDLYDLDRVIGIDHADLVLFGNAGDAWLSGVGPGRVPNDRVPNFNEWAKDVGFGIDTGSWGVYAAKALTGHQPIRLSFRLQRRF